MGREYYHGISFFEEELNFRARKKGVMDYLFDRWYDLKKKLKDKYLFIFLDFDGTLTPIVETPKKAILQEGTRELLRKLSYNPRIKLVLISGRSLEDIKNKIGLRNVIYSGNHGLEIEGPKIKFKTPVSVRYKEILKHIKRDLDTELGYIKGAFIEDKGLALSVHYRLVDKKSIPKVKTIFHETIMLYLIRNKIRVKPGKKVLEVRPPIERDKGKVVLWLLARQQFLLGQNKTFPIYIGDDVTDEDAFKALKNKGITIFVGTPKDSFAKYYLKNTDEVLEFLKRIPELQKCKSICQK